ncbi:MAG: type VI secretion system accessory protein TagJ [Pirellulaceae bacterium]
MTPGELFQAGKLTEAVQAALEAVKKHPTDTDRRGQLIELLCFTGDLERADKQLETIGQQDPQAQMGVSMLRQLVRAENARQQFYQEGRVPEFLGEPSETLKLHLQASIALREGKPQEAVENLLAAEKQRRPIPGKCNGEAFDDFRDLDDLCSAFLEVLTSTGKYYWVPVERVEFLEFRAPERPKDLLWRRCNMKVSDGPEGEVFIPSLYPGTHRSSDDQLRLGRGTEWVETPDAPVRGVGQRTFLVGNADRPIMQLQEVDFARDAS